MRITQTEQASIAVLNELRQAAFDGTLTTDEFIRKVKEKFSQAPKRSILANLEKYGPIGDGSDDHTCVYTDGQIVCGDVAWYMQNELTSRWYNPRTGEPE